MARRTDISQPTPADWSRLLSLREDFVSSKKELSLDYWQDQRLIDLYDQSLGRRIAWKWHAVLTEVAERGLTEALLQGVDSIVDWGCGSGVASETFLSAVHPWRPKQLLLVDRSSKATAYAKDKLQAIVPNLAINAESDWKSSSANQGVLISHVLNEISPAQISRLKTLLSSVRFVLWVEPGAHLQSRKLSELRDALFSVGLRAWAPCLHEKRCPILSDEHSKDWCHFFAPAPGEVHHDPFWAEFSKRMGVDLRANPYAFVLLVKETPPPSSFRSRILERPELQKGYAEISLCSQDGQWQRARIQKREDEDFFKRLKKDPPRYL